MKEDWKSNIGSFFYQNGIFRKEYLNDKLRDNCKEYSKYLNEFQGIVTEVGRYKHIVDEETSFETLITIHLNHEVCNGRIMNAPFKIGLSFNGADNLFIKYSTFYDFRKKTLRIIKGKGDEIEPYSYKEENLNESEIHEKEYVFQIINQRLTNYIELMEKQ